MPSFHDPLKLVGTTIADKYAIESVVGEGGFAIVYCATHLVWKRKVAIKVFKALSDVAESERAKLLEEFIQEGALLAELSERSAAICQARDIGTLDHADKKAWLPYMVLEWLEGASLEAVIARDKEKGTPPRSVERTLQLLEPAADALAIAHRRGIAHRDVKPANLFLCGDPDDPACTVKLLDFGIAKVVQDAQKMAGAFTKTSGAVTAFTPAYGAPEQFSRLHGSTGPWTDVFAFALVLVECFTLKDPLEGDDFMQIGYASADKARRPTPRAKGVELGDALEAVFAKALAVNPADRYRTMGDFWSALRASLPAQSGRLSALVSGVPSGAAVPMAPLGASSNERRTGPAGLATTEVASVPQRLAMTPVGISSTQPSVAKKQSRTRLVASVGAVAALLVAGGGYWAMSRRQAPAAPVLATPSPPVAAPSAPAIAPKPACPDGMIAIEGGRFFMGSNDRDAIETERPAHNVMLSPYCIDRYEVTMARYKACSDSGKCERASVENQFEGLTPKLAEAYDPLCNAREPVARGQHPVNCVSWGMAKAFCSETGARLPTEAEWEFAARGPDGRRYPWGDEAPTSTRLNACGVECVAWGKKFKVPLEAMYNVDDGYAATAPVGSFPQGMSRFGLEDIVGNVWEWVADYAGPYSAEAQNDPSGPEVGKRRVIRGGAWNGSNAAWVRPTFRYHSDPATLSHGIGFRCARSQ